jgi:pectate lyase
VICRKYTGNNSGDEPVQVGTGADGTNCFYSSSDLTYR